MNEDDPFASLDWSTVSATDSASSPSTSSNSVWGSGLLSTINSLAGTAGTVYGAVQGKPKATVAAAKPSGIAQYLPYIIGVVVVLVLGAVLMRRR